MNCPACGSACTIRLQRTTNLGYALFRGKAGCRTFIERIGTPFNFIEVPTDIVLQVPIVEHFRRSDRVNTT